MTTPVDLWYGDGDRNPLGPIESVLVEQRPHAGPGVALIKVLDPTWLDHMGIDDGDFQYECGRLPPDHFVSRDDYAWSPKGEGAPSTKWW